MCAKQQLGVVLDGRAAGEQYHDLGKMEGGRARVQSSCCRRCWAGAHSDEGTITWEKRVCTPPASKRARAHTHKLVANVRAYTDCSRVVLHRGMAG